MSWEDEVELQEFNLSTETVSNETLSIESVIEVCIIHFH